LPNHAGLKDASLRIGDLVTHDGQQFRVMSTQQSHGLFSSQIAQTKLPGRRSAF
jgi:hypothetical protein